MAFKPGHKKVGGRTKGSQNKATAEMREVWREFLTSSEYQAKLKERIMHGKAERVEQLMFHYAFGKPVDMVELTGEGSGPVKITAPFAAAVIRAAEHAKAREGEIQSREPK